MKMRIEIDENLSEEEIIIKCPQLNSEIANLQKEIAGMFGKERKISFERDEKEYFIPIKDILFFETQDKKVYVHTADSVYHSKYKLYELEQLLPHTFVRVSKSSILNTKQIYSISWNIASSSVVEFSNTSKKVYVSRTYYKVLKELMADREKFGG